MLNGCAYILTVDVGNTFIRFGLFAEDSAAAQERRSRRARSRRVEHYGRRSAYASRAGHGRAGGRCGHAGRACAHGCRAELCGPGARAPVKAALSRTCTGRVLTVGPGLKTGMPVHYDDPAEIGPDRIADAWRHAPSTALPAS